jgi:hypothetical protein
VRPIGLYTAVSSQEQAVIVRVAFPFQRGDAMLDGVFALEDRLIQAISAACVGEFDGDEVGKGELALYMYGPDAERLFATVEPLLRDVALMRGATVTVRQGQPGAIARLVEL